MSLFRVFGFAATLWRRKRWFRKESFKRRYDLRVENHVPHGSFSASKTIDDENCKRIMGG